MSLRDRIREELELIGFHIGRLLQSAMEGPLGVNDKINDNTLIDSDVYESIKSEVPSDTLELIEVWGNDYLKYIEGGMQPGHWMKEEYLLPWMAKRGIPSDAIARIQGSIYWYGIAPRPVMQEAMAHIGQLWEEDSQALFEAILSDIEDWFHN